MNRTNTRTAVIFKDDSGIIHIKIQENKVIDYEDALDNYLVVKHLSDNEPTLKLIDFRVHYILTKKAKHFLESKEIKSKTVARAFLVKKGFHQILFSIGLLFSVSGVQSKVFTNYDSAYAWLLAQKRKNNYTSLS